jgi:hypothetical protein
MKIKITTELFNANDETIKDTNGKDLTVKDVCINALLIPQSGDDDKTKWEKYELYKRLKTAKDIVEISAEDIVLLKKAIGKTQPPLIMGQAWEVLESKN